MREIIKFADGTKLPLYKISSTDTELTILVLDSTRYDLEEICKDAEKTAVIQYVSVNDDTLDETILKGYAGYTNLVSMKIEYGVTTNIDYETTDSTTESGFAEETHDVATVILAKPSKIASEIEELKQSQSLQDGAIEELAEVISEMVEE